MTFHELLIVLILFWSLYDSLLLLFNHQVQKPFVLRVQLNVIPNILPDRWGLELYFFSHLEVDVMMQSRSLDSFKNIFLELFLLLLCELNRALKTTFGSRQKLDFLKALIINISNKFIIFELFNLCTAWNDVENLFQKLWISENTFYL